MSPRPLTAAALLLLAACDAQDGHEDHEHDVADPVGQDQEARPDVAAPAPAALAGPEDFAVGTWTATLEPTAEALRLTVRDAEGQTVTSAGEVRVVLTGTGEEEQRVVLSPTEGGWSGEAKVAGAVGYVAVVSLDIDGHTETARVTWGEVPEAAPAPKAEEPDHEDAHEHGHGHDH